MDIFCCHSCGHLEFRGRPHECPVCGGDEEGYTDGNRIFWESWRRYGREEFQHIPDVRVQVQGGKENSGEDVSILIVIEKLTHPMLVNHYIRFIDLYRDNVFFGRTEFDSRGVALNKRFVLTGRGKRIRLVECCSLHGYWKTDIYFENQVMNMPRLADSPPHHPRLARLGFQPPKAASSQRRQGKPDIHH